MSSWHTKTKMPWNPEKAKATQFTTDRPESCTAKITVRIPPSLKEELKNLDNWQEKVRQFLQEEVKNQSA